MSSPGRPVIVVALVLAASALLAAIGTLQPKGIVGGDNRRFRGKLRQIPPTPIVSDGGAGDVSLSQDVSQKEQICSSTS